jgi:hypothetical protein
MRLRSFDGVPGVDRVTGTDGYVRLPRFGGAREGELYDSTKGETIHGERATSL